MRYYFYIFIFLLLAVSIPSGARALIIMDAATKVEDVVEMTIEVIKTLDEKMIALEAKQRDQKLGEMGRGAQRYYDTLFRELRKDRKLNFLDVPSFLAGSVNSIDKAEKEIKEKYIAVFDKNDTAISQLQSRLNNEIEQNLAVDTYTKAYTLRNHLARERQNAVPVPKPENTRELIETGRAYTEKTIQRFNDVLVMETFLLDFENTEVLMDTDPIRLGTAKEDESAGEK